MRLTAHRLDRLKRSLELALNQEWPRLSAATNHLAALHPTPIAIRPAQASTLPVVAGVATDGGENRLSLEPMQLQIVRVADSSRFRAVGKLVRREAQTLIVGYTFNLRTNTLKPESAENPAAGTEHNFVAHRLKCSATEAVAMRPPREVIAEVAKAAEEDE